MQPDFSLETQYTGLVCGIDEAGRAPLAGPVTAACVYIPEHAHNFDFIKLIKDSKKLSKPLRERLYPLIQQHCAYGIANVMQDEIDALNIHHASLLAMKRAFLAMNTQFNLDIQMALIDGKFSPALPCKALPVIKGDNISLSIAAASILAKVNRDNQMQALHKAHPHYGWSTNVGYPTPSHKSAILEHGITKHHRRSFAPVKAFLKSA